MTATTDAITFQDAVTLLAHVVQQEIRTALMPDILADLSTRAERGDQDLREWAVMTAEICPTCRDWASYCLVDAHLPEHFPPEDAR